jgi:uncharacterized protein YjbJ (UPF0337 family)
VGDVRLRSPNPSINFKQEIAMNWDTISGKWMQVKGQVKEKWGKLTDDDLARIEGVRDRLSGVIQERYGLAKDEAEKQLAEFEHRCKC